MPVTKTEGVEVTEMGNFTDAFIAYIMGFVGGIPILLMKDSSEFMRKHAAYSSVMGFFAWLAFMGAWHMNPGYPHFGPAMYVVYTWLVYAAFGIWKAVRGETYRIPVIDGMAEKLIKAIEPAV
ncbi:hypothetical protein [Thermococcus sp.]|uniref:hypothetical protein n=1 Tax=Thermococcus sp. TaxID=35749 RepID=UPI00262F932E|nr:hypothetical protein [Thermococcus sp.]